MKKEFGYVQDREGNAVAGAEVYIRKQADNTLATLYSDDGSTTTANPLTTDNDGEWSAYWEDGVYKIQVYVEGVQQQEVNNVQHFDIDGFTSFGISLVSSASASAARSTLELGTIATQASSGVSITGGSIAGITDLAVADGGTGASSASSARSNLGAAASGPATASGITMATNRLLGRTTASSGAVEEISVGNGLSLADGSLVASATGDVMAFLGDFTKWDTAKARGASLPARCLFSGDSNVTGEGVTGYHTDAFDKSFARLFADAMGWQTGSIYGNQNVGWPSNLTIAYYEAYNPTVSHTGGWHVSTGGDDIIGGTLFKSLSAAGGTFTWTPEEEFAKLKFIYPRSTGLNASITVKIDGVTVDTLSQDGASAVLAADYSTTLGAHTVEIQCSGSGDAYIQALEINDGTDTPVYVQGGWSGALAADFALATNPWSALNELSFLDFDYVFHYCTINDANDNTALQTYYAKIEAFVAAASATADGCLMVGYPSNANNTTNGYTDDQAQILRNIAQDYGWSFFDFRQMLGRSYVKVTALGYAHDSRHPSSSGHAAMASALHDFIGSSL